MILLNNSFDGDPESINNVQYFIGTGLVKELNMLSSIYSLDQSIFSYNVLIPEKLLTKRIRKYPVDSGIFKFQSSKFIKLSVPKSITSVKLLCDDKVLAELVNETTDKYVNERYDNYDVDESLFDKVVIIKLSSSDSSNLEVDIHKSQLNINAHREHIVYSYYDSDYYTYIPKVLMDNFKLIKNIETNCCFCITEDFSKQLLGVYKDPGPAITSEGYLINIGVNNRLAGTALGYKTSTYESGFQNFRVPYGSTIWLKATVNDNYRFIRWSGDYVSSLKTTEIQNITRNMTIIAEFDDDSALINENKLGYIFNEDTSLSNRKFGV